MASQSRTILSARKYFKYSACLIALPWRARVCEVTVELRPVPRWSRRRIWKVCQHGDTEKMTLTYIKWLYVPGTPCRGRKGQIPLPVVVDIRIQDHPANTQTTEEAFHFVQCREMLQAGGRFERTGEYALHLACCNLRGHRRRAQPLEVCLEEVSHNLRGPFPLIVASYPHGSHTRDSMETPVD